MNIERKDGLSRLQHKDFALEVKEYKEADGTFAGYASVFGIEDDGSDIVMKGAFTQTLAELASKGRTLPMLWCHDPMSPLGGYTTLREDDRGLYCEGKFTPGVEKADETRALMKDGVINGLSIGYRTKRYEIDNSNPDVYRRKLLEVKLYEISVVTFPMLDDARVTDVKSIVELEPREIEKLFKDAGLSGKDAKLAVSVVQKMGQRDVDPNRQRDADVAKSARDAAALGTLLDTLRATRQGLQRK